MAYNNYYPTAYQPMYQPNAYPTQVNVGSNQTNTQNPLIWVQGEAAAKSYPIAPNTSVPLFDSEANVIYIKSADMSGMPSIKILDYTVRENAPQKADIQPVGDFATKDDLLSIQKEIDALKSKFNGRKNDGK